MAIEVRDTLYFGVDPGKFGYFAGVKGSDVFWFEPVPTYTVGKSKKEFDRERLCRVVEAIESFQEEQPVHVVVEHQQVFPKQGAVSAFSTGYGYGLLTMSLQGRVPYTEVRPSDWKKSMGLAMPREKNLSAAVRKKRLKAKALREAQRLFPDFDFLPTARSKKPNADLAEAVLIAVYGSRKRL